jgi:adenine deaminase
VPAAVAAASRNPLALLGVTDRGRLAAGHRADLVELDDDLHVQRVMKAGEWLTDRGTPSQHTSGNGLSRQAAPALSSGD